MHEADGAVETFFEAFNASSYHIESIKEADRSDMFAIIIADTPFQLKSDVPLGSFKSVSELDRYIRQKSEGTLPLAIILSTPKGVSVLNRNFMVIVTVISDGYDIEEYPAPPDSSEEPRVFTIDKRNLAFLYLSNTSDLTDFIKEHASKSIFINKVIKHYSKVSPLSDVLLFMVNNLFYNMESSQISYKVPATKLALEELQFEVEEMLMNRHDVAEHTQVQFMTSMTELLMNAYEHGVLSVTPEEKQSAILSDSFDRLLSEREAQKVSSQHLIDVVITFYESRYVLLRVTDDGKGFDYQMDHYSGANEFRGRGLLMVRNMSDALFFDLDGRRSSAFFRLSPLKVQSEIPERETTTYAEKLNLLYVEDEASTRVLFTEIFKEMFQNVYMATNGEEAFELARRIKPDLIVSDLSMPKMNGLELAEKIKHLFPDMTFILLTAYDNSSELIKAIEIGVDRLFKKPVMDYALFSTEIERIAKSVYLKKEMQRRLMQEELQKESYIHTLRTDSDKYRMEHEQAWAKEKLIIHDDSGLITSSRIHLHFKPLDILSGDIYGVLKIDEKRSILYILDGMGKGLSASVTSVLSAAFLNRSIILSVEKEDFCFESMMDNFRDFIQPYLLNVETLSLHIMMIDSAEHAARYCGFGVYPLLLRSGDGEDVVSIKAKNPPLSRYTREFVIQDIEFASDYTIVLYSDGFVEHNEFGFETLVELVQQSENFTQFQRRLASVINLFRDTFEDDVTMLYVQGK